MCQEVESELPSTTAQIYFPVRNKWWRCRSRGVRVNKSAAAREGTLVSVVMAFIHCAVRILLTRPKNKKEKSAK